MFAVFVMLNLFFVRCVQIMIIDFSDADQLSGISLKLLAYEKFLQEHESYPRDVVLIQKVIVNANNARGADGVWFLEANRCIVERIREVRNGYDMAGCAYMHQWYLKEYLPLLRQYSYAGSRNSFGRLCGFSLYYLRVPMFWTYGSVCCVRAQRPGSPRACHSS